MSFQDGNSLKRPIPGDYFLKLSIHLVNTVVWFIIQCKLVLRRCWSGLSWSYPPNDREESELMSSLYWVIWSSILLSHKLVLDSHIQSHLKHQHDKTSQSFWKVANHVFEAEDLFIVLTAKKIIPWRWTWIWWVGVSTTLYQATLQC